MINHKTQTEKRQADILEYITLENAVTIREIKEFLKIGFTTAERLLNNMVIEGKIYRKNKTFNNRTYFLYLSLKQAKQQPQEQEQEQPNKTAQQGEQNKNIVI